jgi:hypothetical protein
MARWTARLSEWQDRYALLGDMPPERVVEMPAVKLVMD